MSKRSNKLPMSVLEVTLLKTNEYNPHYVVILVQPDENIYLPIMIDGAVAYAIDVALKKVATARPLTHDLLKNILSAYNITVKEVIISDFKDSVFYATIVCVDENGEVKEFDSRASDAIAIALRTNAPIYAHRFVLDEAGMVTQTEEKESSSSEKKSSTPAKAEKTSKINLEDLTPENIKNLSDKELKALLDEAVKKEMYEIAALIHAELERRQQDS
ncbi:MAG: bifunctional nuclease family protein [Chlorobi bacterium]|nr:bifunctional nuclease family protein [Chlorobiota bacterium]